MVARFSLVVLIHIYTAAILLLFSSGGDALTTKGSVSFHLRNITRPGAAGSRGPSSGNTNNGKKSPAPRKRGFTTYPDFLDYHHSTFAFTPTGVFSGSFDIPHKNCTHLVFCTVTDAIVRDYSYQMKRVIWDKNWKNDIARKICDPTEKTPIHFEVCTPKKLDANSNEINFRMPIRKNSFIFVQLVVCPKCYHDLHYKKSPVSGSYEIEMKNIGSRYPQLGFDESVYPIAPTLFLALSICLFGVISSGIFLTTYRNLNIPFVAKVVLAASILKIISTGLTTAAFWKYAVTGEVLVWFFVLRVPLIIADEIAIGLLMLVMSTGVGLMPATWMFDRRSSTFAVFLGLALEVFTVVTSEVFYMFQYMGMVVFIFSGGTVAFICVLYSWRNARFLAKYAKLITLANIYVSSTPLLRMSLFFHVNSAIVVTIWLFKVVSFGIMDHVLKRADILWALFEAADIAFLSWYAFSVFPRRKSAYYVNMSNVNNDRLRQVNDWHLRQQRRLRAAAGDEDASINDDGDDLSGIVVADESGTIRLDRNNNNNNGDGDSAGHLTGSADSEAEDLEPAMISWNSGDPLPSPHSGMWNMQEEMRRVLKRSKPPDATAVRVLGSPRGDLKETLALSIARPVLGPDTEKKANGNGIVIGSPYADRERRRNSSRHRNRNNNEDGEEDGDGGYGYASRELSGISDISYEPFSIPSSNASADGEVFSTPQPEDNMRDDNEEGRKR